MSDNGYTLVNAAIKSQSTTTYSVSLDCIVLLKITVDIPNLPLDFSNWKTPHCIQRADPTLNTTRSITNRIQLTYTYVQE